MIISYSKLFSQKTASGVYLYSWFNMFNYIESCNLDIKNVSKGHVLKNNLLA